MYILQRQPGYTWQLSATGLLSMVYHGTTVETYAEGVHTDLFPFLLSPTKKDGFQGMHSIPKSDPRQTSGNENYKIRGPKMCRRPKNKYKGALTVTPTSQQPTRAKQARIKTLCNVTTKEPLLLNPLFVASHSASLEDYHATVFLLGELQRQLRKRQSCRRRRRRCCMLVTGCLSTRPSYHFRGVMSVVVELLGLSAKGYQVLLRRRGCREQVQSGIGIPLSCKIPSQIPSIPNRPKPDAAASNTASQRKAQRPGPATATSYACKLK